MADFVNSSIFFEFVERCNVAFSVFTFIQGVSQNHTQTFSSMCGFYFLWTLPLFYFLYYFEMRII